MEAVRLFIAIAAPPQLQDQLHDAAELLKRSLQSPLRLRAIPRENLHCTVVFLGDTPQTELPHLKSALQNLSRSILMPRIRPAAGGIFPARGKPRAAWCGVEDIDYSLAAAARMVAKELGRPMTSYKPHFTLGYFKGTQALLPSAAAAARRSVVEACRSTIDVPEQPYILPAMQLYRSVLAPGGAQHTVLGNYVFSDSSENSG